MIPGSLLTSHPLCPTGVIYDSDKADARLIGIEYVVNEEVFVALPEEEKKYWHR